MFPQLNQKVFEQLATNPVSFLNALHEFQCASFVAAKQIAENNIHAFQELATVRDPQSYMKVQPAVLKAVTEQNIEILTKLWQTFGVTIPGGSKE